MKVILTILSPENRRVMAFKQKRNMHIYKQSITGKND